MGQATSHAFEHACLGSGRRRVCLVATGLRSRADRQERTVQKNAAGERELAWARNEMLDGQFPVAELSRLETTLESEPGLAELHHRVSNLLEEARRRRDDRDARQDDRNRYEDFRKRRYDALFQDTQLTGLDRSENVTLIRKASLSALELFALDGRKGADWALAPLPASLTEQERHEVVLGCYEMLMVLAESVSQPLDGESVAGQAKEALRILERARELRPQPACAYHVRRADCLEKAGDAEGAKHELAVAEMVEPDGAFDHFLTGLEWYKRGFLKEARQHLGLALQVQPNHFWAQCLLAICDLNARPPRAAEAKIRLTACLQSQPDLAWLYLLRGFAAGELGAAVPAEAAGHFDDAEADYREALERDRAGKFRYALLANRGLLSLPEREGRRGRRRP